jgi:hypothetical protein
LKFILNSRTKVDVAPKKEKSIYDLTKQEDDLDNNDTIMKDVDIDFDDNINNTAGTPKDSVDDEHGTTKGKPKNNAI